MPGILNGAANDNCTSNLGIVSGRSQIALSAPYPSGFIKDSVIVAKRNSILAPHFIINKIVPVVDIRICIAERQGRNCFRFFFYLDRDCELVGSQGTRDFRGLRGSVVCHCCLDDVFLLLAVIYDGTGFYRDRCFFAVAQRDDFKCAVESRIVGACRVQGVSVGVHANFIGNVGYRNRAAGYGMASVTYRECYIGDGRLVVDRSYVYGRRVFGGRVVACAGADNLVLERCVVVTEIIGLGLVSELTQICDIYDLVSGNCRSIVCERSGSREPRDDDGGECLGCMAEIEFGLRKCMTGVFVDVDDKFFRDGRKFIGIRDKDVKASLRFVIVVHRDIGSVDITDDKPKFFATGSAGFDKTVN